MKEFIYHEPKTVKEALSLLSQFKGEAKLKAGGTDFLVKMKKETVAPRHLINLKEIQELTYIDHLPEEKVKVGSLTTLSEIEDSAIIRDKFNLLRQSISNIASPQVRNRGTLGGNILQDSRCQYYNQSRQWLGSLDPCYKRGGRCCHVLLNGDKCSSIFSGDAVPALMILKARVKLINVEGERVVPIEDFYTGAGTRVNKIHPDEMLTEIQIPEPKKMTKSVYLKISERGDVDFPILGVAVSVVLDRDETLQEMDTVIIGTGPGPIRLSRIGEMLRGQKPDPGTIQEACKRIPEMVHPISNALGLSEYKSKLLPSLVSHAIKAATVFGEGKK